MLLITHQYDHYNMVIWVKSTTSPWDHDEACPSHAPLAWFGHVFTKAFQDIRGTTVATETLL